ncbi:Mpo1-like protein [uncultured Endozoicomonas sp.]|uniref:Mpo1 family 2-hydroxy fatty acid dioxygenase n=1 Tax=uncultured Endozoicomonas sp. TaxID=432652 RepID=UPI002629AD93|nr:Mpo1-like protein [uncultured Endozoicomonas sp.]
MKTIEQWFSEYGESHQNKTNKLIHWICVPAILFSIVGIIWAFSPIAAWVLMAVTMLFYFKLSFKLSLAMILIFAASAALSQALGAYVLEASIGIFVVAWIFQFVGHKVEGKKPSFFDDLKFLLIGPLWCLGFLFRKLNISY